MKYLTTKTLLCLSILSLSACSTITRGSTEEFVIESEPAGANVTLSTNHSCVTPCTLELKRKTEFDLTLNKKGYKEFKTHISSEIAGGGAAGLAGNILAGGIIGAAIDAGTGSALSLTPNPVNVILEKNGSTLESRLDLTKKEPVEVAETTSTMNE